MCHAYSITTNVEAIRQMVRDMFDFDVAGNIGNLPPQTGIYPDMLAPIIRNQPGFRELVKVRWGMPSSSKALYLAAKERARKIEEKEGRRLTPEQFDDMVRMEPGRGVGVTGRQENSRFGRVREATRSLHVDSGRPDTRSARCDRRLPLRLRRRHPGLH